MRVYPREPLEAEHGNDYWWLDRKGVVPVPECYTDAEFANAFVDASVVEAVLQAAMAFADHAKGTQGPLARDLIAAVSAYREAVR